MEGKDSLARKGGIARGARYDGDAGVDGDDGDDGGVVVVLMTVFIA